MLPCSPATSTSFRLANATANKFPVTPLSRSFHVSPPSSVRRTIPRAPTMYPRCPSAKASAYSHSLRLRSTRFQFSPPFSVCRIVPPEPTATPCNGSTNLTSSSQLSEFVCWNCQLSPSSLVCQTAPRAPTTHPSSAEINETPNKSSVAGFGIVAHVTPPFVERRIVPLLPTTQPDFSLVKVIAFSVVVDPEGRMVQLLPPEFVKKMLARSSRPPSVSLCQDRPPSSVRTTKPSAPAAQPSDSSEKNSVASLGSVRTLTGSQIFPPSPVVSITPASPAAQPCSSSVKKTEYRSVVTSEPFEVHDSPASSVWRMVP